MEMRLHAVQERLHRLNSPSLQWSGERPPADYVKMKQNVILNCGWGRLFFGQTFSDHDHLIQLFLAETKGTRDLAMYVQDHHVLLTRAPDLLFIDPSDTYRLWLYNYRFPKNRSARLRVRWLQDEADTVNVNVLYRKTDMLQCPIHTLLHNQRSRIFSYAVAEDVQSGVMLGTITGIDHREAFSDPENGASFWCLAVDPDQRARGVGRALVRFLIEHYLARGRQYLDLSVLHDNKPAINLYRSLGFRRVPAYVIKRKNDFNREYYTGGPQP